MLDIAALSAPFPRHPVLQTWRQSFASKQIRTTKTRNSAELSKVAARGATTMESLERAVAREEWTLAQDRKLRKELSKLTDEILRRAGEVSTNCKRASRSVETKLIEVDLLINSFERISTVQFVENVSHHQPPPPPHTRASLTLVAAAKLRAMLFRVFRRESPRTTARWTRAPRMRMGARQGRPPRVCTRKSRTA